ncbi:uncharacterized protein LOC124939738 [Impatiens glandulifera]|uniref:uncharacterized protein LOC124939738 n=1 Tax=Impatiens glandulifera TaxID=253017 RepID=UPI001FB142A3|nr:uncharacterized protein LOC124939738 [Impatiens glandulifera]
MMNSSELQIWNNAAFDGTEFENIKKVSSWSSFKQDIVNPSDALDTDSIKENWSLQLGKSPIPVKTPAPGKPLQPTGNSVLILNKRNPNKKETAKKVVDDEIRDDKMVDSEIEEIQKEISRLTSRLDTLRLEKAELKIKALEKLGRMVPAKFMEQKKNETKGNQRRGLTMGPSEITAGFRRGVSMGPAEISRQQLRKQEVAAALITPSQPIQNRRKSCFWKLEDVDEKRAVTKERGSSFTVSPKWRKDTAKITPALRRQAATTVGSKKPVKKEGGIISSSIQPKTLFRDGDNKSLPMKKPPMKVVASRYNPPSTKFFIRNRSLPEIEEEEEEEETDKKKGEKKRVSSSTGNSTECLSPPAPEIASEENQSGYGMRKKRWEIPNEIVIHRNAFDEISPVALLPMIRTVRLNAVETPRDSGPAKRVVDMIGRKSYFCNEDDEEELSVPKALNFAEEEEN